METFSVFERNDPHCMTRVLFIVKLGPDECNLWMIPDQKTQKPIWKTRIPGTAIPFHSFQVKKCLHSCSKFGISLSGKEVVYVLEECQEKEATDIRNIIQKRERK